MAVNKHPRYQKKTDFMQPASMPMPDQHPQSPTRQTVPSTAVAFAPARPFLRELRNSKGDFRFIKGDPHAL